MKIDQPGNTLGIARILNAEEELEIKTPKESLSTGVASVADSFVQASSDKAFLSSAVPIADNLQNQKHGAISGLEVTDTSHHSTEVTVRPGLGLTAGGHEIDTASSNMEPAASKRNSFFDGKLLNAQDLQAEQDYKRGNRHLIEASRLDITGPFRSSAVFDRLSTLTGKSSEELLSLLNKYGLSADNLPIPPDDKVNSFIHDPAFASYAPQALLTALYGQ